MRSHCACSCRDNVGHFKEVCTENEVEMQAVRLAILTRATDVRGFAYGVIFCCAELEKDLEVQVSSVCQNLSGKCEFDSGAPDLTQTSGASRGSRKPTLNHFTGQLNSKVESNRHKGHCCSYQGALFPECFLKRRALVVLSFECGIGHIRTSQKRHK